MDFHYLIISSATLVAITLAISVFLLPKTVEIYNTRWRSIKNLDMPDSVRNDKYFIAIVFLDNIGMFFLALASLFLSMYFISILINAISAYYGLAITFLFNKPLSIELIRALKILWFILATLLVVFILWLSAGKQVSKKLPVINKAYIEMTLDTSWVKGLKQELLGAARKYLQEGSYNEAILYSITSLEYELGKKLNLGSDNSFASVMSKLIYSDLAWIIPREINDLIIIRNNIAHKKSTIDNGEKEAKYVIESVNRILDRLDILGASIIYK